MHLSDLLCFPWRHPRNPPAADPPIRGHSSSTRPPNDDRISQPGRFSIGREQNDTEGQLAHASLMIEGSNLTPTPQSVGLSSQLHVHLPQQTNSELPESRALLSVPHQLQGPAAVSQESVHSQRLVLSRNEDSSASYNVQSSHDSRNVSIDGNQNTVNYTNNVVSGSNNFMEKLLNATILGAAFDSSARDPPPRCHPGTRLAIVQRCVDFVINCTDERKIRWVFGAAGVGKSAIMQSVAESALSFVIFRASIFFFVNGRSDGTKAIITLAYQLATKSELYRQFIEREIFRDPSLLHSSMSVQFNKFIIEPFINYPQLTARGRVLIIIDGLDECDQSRTQRELLRLIFDCCLAHPTSPIVWMIASRPEPHILSFFAQSSVQSAYEKEEIPVDSDEARADVEKFLRGELKKIQDEFSLNSPGQWPSEQDFWKLADASGGLFAYAQTVTKYIGDPDMGDPMLQLQDVLRVIDAHPLQNVRREEHPMALLDALYARILSRVPTKVEQNARKLLLALAGVAYRDTTQEAKNFIVLCNWLGMTCNEAYAALRRLTSVMIAPGPDKAHDEQLRSFHKSFIDYISDFSRSGFSSDIEHEARELYVQCTARILGQAPDGIDVGELSYSLDATGGALLRGPGNGNILLAWPVDAENGWDNSQTRLQIYKMAFTTVVVGIERQDQTFYNTTYIHLLATRLRSLTDFSSRILREFMFNQSRRHEFLEQGLLRQIPVKMLNPPQNVLNAKLQFRRPTCHETNVSDPWNQSCNHEREGEWREGKDQMWSTCFDKFECTSCCARLDRQLVQWKTLFPDHLVTVLFTSADGDLVEFQFVDLVDGVSEWTYWLVQDFSEEERKKLGSSV